MIEVGARSSPLSLVQCEEVLQELRQHHPQVQFSLKKIFTIGDKDKKTSLRTLGKSDFFTKEIDQMLLEGTCRIAIHSAKDLPDPLPEGLQMVALTRGLDPSDALVMRSGESFASLPKGAIVATSSERREAIVRAMRPDLRFCDLRGTIGERLEKLQNGEADAVVVAEAALIRLSLSRLNRIILPGETVANQGQLAVLARKNDREIQELFASIDVRKAPRKRILHLGLKAPSPIQDQEIVHCPIIQIRPRTFKIDTTPFTHLIFTSKTSVDLFPQFQDKQVIAVGHATALRLMERGIPVTETALDERAEGIIDILERKNLKDAHILWPHSAGSRPTLRQYLEKRGIRFQELILYDTVPLQPDPLPDLTKIDEIVFTSPSTVDAFLQFFGAIPKKRLKAIGPVTEAHLEAHLREKI